MVGKINPCLSVSAVSGSSIEDERSAAAPSRWVSPIYSIVTCHQYGTGCAGVLHRHDGRNCSPVIMTPLLNLECDSTMIEVLAGKSSVPSP